MFFCNSVEHPGLVFTSPSTTIDFLQVEAQGSRGEAVLVNFRTCMMCLRIRRGNVGRFTVS